MRAVAAIRFEDSRQMVDALDESRDLLRDSLEEFKREHREYRGQVEAIMRNKQVLIHRQKGENLSVLSEVATSFHLLKRISFRSRYSVDKSKMSRV